jgi:hypothetical protein
MSISGVYDTGKISFEEMIDKGRQSGALQDKAHAKMKGLEKKKKAVAKVTKQEMEDIGPILRT